MKVFENIALTTLNLNRDLFTKHGLHLNNKGKELAARKIVSSIKHMLHKKTKEPIYMTWKDDYVKGTQENLNSQEYQVRGHEEERNSPEKERGMLDSQEDTDLQAERCQDLNDDVTTTVPSKRIRKPPVTRKDDFFMDGHQQSKFRSGIKVDNRKDLNSSQISILHHNVQCLKNKLLELTILLQSDLKNVDIRIMFY
jgi:hypothetical protein